MLPEAWSQAIQLVFFSPEVWGVVIVAAVFGVFIGSTPGLTATMAVALLIPLAYWMDPVPAIAAIVTLVACAIFAGDIPNAWLRIPGTPASAAYVDDAFSFARRGLGRQVLLMSLVFSVFGGLVGAVILMVVGQQLAQIAAWFSVAEYFWLYVLGLSCALVVHQGSLAKACCGLLIGLLLSTVGMSAAHSEARFTFGEPELYPGINFIAAMIGLFGISELLRNALLLDSSTEASAIPPMVGKDSGAAGKGDAAGSSVDSASAARATATPGDRFDANFGMLSAVRRVWRNGWSAVRSALIGTGIGILPGAGADIAAFVSLAVSRRRQPAGQTEDDRKLAGIADATTANSASLAGAWVPALVFGIPGDSITAIVIGVLMMKNVKPGPEIFAKTPELVYSIYLTFILANLVLLPVGWLAIRASSIVTRIPRRVLLPLILLFCTVGSFAINGSYFDVSVMLAMGLAGFLLDAWGVPLGPLVLGMILGGPLEERAMQTLAAGQGSAAAFVQRPLAATLALVCLGVWVLVLASSRKRAESK